MRTLSLLVVVGLALPAAADDAPKAIVEKAIKATGGADLLKKFKASKSKFTGTVHAMGMEIEMKGEALALYPDKGKVTATLSIAGMEVPLVQTIDGKKFRMTIAGNEIPVPEEQAAEGAQSMYVAFLGRLVPLLEKDVTLAAADKAEVDGKPAVGVKATKEGKPDVTLYFDAASGLLVKTVHKGKAEDGSEVEKEGFYSDYKAVQGVQMAHREKELSGGKPHSDLKLEGVELLETLPADLFGAD